MTSNILEAYKFRLREVMNDKADYVATGGCLQAENVALDYAKNAGVIEGLAIAERTLLDAIEDAEKRERDE